MKVDAVYLRILMSTTAMHWVMLLVPYFILGRLASFPQFVPSSSISPRVTSDQIFNTSIVEFRVHRVGGTLECAG